MRTAIIIIIYYIVTLAMIVVVQQALALAAVWNLPQSLPTVPDSNGYYSNKNKVSEKDACRENKYKVVSTKKRKCS